jgi:PAS domain S-box-containing protein
MSRKDQDRQQVQQAAERFHDLLRCSTDWIWEVDAAWRYTYSSDQVAAILGYKAEEILGKRMFDLMPPDAVVRVAEVLETRAAEGDPIDDLRRRCLSKDGDVVHVLTNAMPRFDDAGELVGYRGLDRDITARVEAEQAQQTLEERQTFFLRVLDNNPNFVFVRDREGRFVLANRAIAEAYGTTPEQMVGKTDADFNPSEESLAAIRRSDARVFESMEETFIPETPIIRDGRWVQTIKRPLVDEEGEPRWILGISSDITERKRMEQVIQASLERRGRQVQTSTEVAQEIAAAPALDELFLRVVTLVKERFGYYHAQIFRYDPHFETQDSEQGAMRLVVGYGEVGQEMLEARHHLPLGRGVVGTAAVTGEPVLASDVAEDPDWLPNVFLPETRGELAVPIKLRDEILGILDVQSDTPGALTEEDQLLLEGLCGQIAIAIESTQLLEEASIFRQVIEASGQGIGMATLDGTVTYANPALGRMMGASSPEAMVGTSILQYYPPEMQRRLEEDVLPVVWEAGRWQGELALRTPEGETTPIIENLFLIRDQDDTPLYLATQITDITGRKAIEDALALERHLLHALLNNIPDHIYFKDAESRFIRVSQAMAQWMGVEDTAQLVGKTDFDFFSQEHAQQAYEDEQNIMRTGEPLVGVEEKETWPDGRVTWVSTTKLPLRDEDGQIVGTFGISTDITARKQAEIERERLLVESERQARRLQETLDETATLYRASQFINTATSMEEILLGLMVGIELPSVMYADLNLFNRPWMGTRVPDHATVVAVWWAADSPETRDAPGAPEGAEVGDRVKLARYPLVPFLRSDEPLVIMDVVADDRLDAQRSARYQEIFGPNSLMALPLVAGGRWIGFFTAVIDGAAEFDAAHMRRLMALAGQVAVAVQNLRLLSQTQEQLMDLATIQTTTAELATASAFEEAVALLLPHVNSAVHAASVSMFLVDEEAEVFTRVGRYPLREEEDAEIGRTYAFDDYPLTRDVVESHQVLAITADDERLQPHARDDFEAAGFTASAVVPLVGRENVLGTLVVSLKPPRTEFDEHDLRILQMLANQTAVAFENIRLLEDARDRARRQQALREITAIVSVSTNVRDLIVRLSDIVAPLRRLVPVDVLTVAAYTPGEQELILFTVAAEQEGEHFARPGTFIPLEGSAPGWVITRREPLLTDDLREAPMFDSDARLIEEGIVSRLILPLQFGDVVVGTLNLGAGEPAAYTAEQLPTLRLVATQIAQALEHARLLERTQEAREEVEATHRSYLQREWRDYVAATQALLENAIVYDQGEIAVTPDFQRPEVTTSLRESRLTTTQDLEAEQRPEVQARSGLAIPIEVRGQVLGVLGFEDPEGSWRWSEDQVALIQTIADQLGQALETARLLETTQRRALRERLAVQITDQMRRATTMDELLQTTVEAIAAALRTPGAFVQLTPQAQSAPSDDGEREV